MRQHTAAFLIILLTTTALSAEVYQWVDDKGVVTFKDTPPPASRKKRDVKVYNDSDFAPAPPVSVQPQKARGGARQGSASAAAPKKESYVEIFTTEWCPYCKQAIALLQSKGVRFTQYDIEKDSAAKERKEKLDKQRGVPFALINGKPIHGFAKEAYEQLLDGASTGGRRGW